MNSQIRIESKFRKVYIELESLEREIYRKSGFLFFKSHIHTIEELLDSPHHHKVFSITEKIGDDMKSWFNAGKLTTEEEEIYHFERDKTDDELHRINMNIKDREPTLWEEIKVPFVEFGTMILNNLPEAFKSNMLLSFFKKIPKLLVFKKV